MPLWLSIPVSVTLIVFGIGMACVLVGLSTVAVLEIFERLTK